MNLKFAFRIIFIFLFNPFTYSLAQTVKRIGGAILQDGTKASIEQVEVRNQRSGQMVYSDKLGRFELISNIGDTLEIQRIGYQPQKTVVQNFTNLIIRLKLSNRLKEVVITGKLASQNFREISTAYSKEKGIFYGGKPPLRLLSPFGGSPVTFFYELLGKDGRRVRRLNQLAKQAAEAEEIDRHFNDLIIQQTIPIDSAQLEEFKLNYTPKLDKLKQWSRYDVANYIKISFEEFKKRNRVN
ncbi:hypothetical protein [Pedobacter gandavensis]|uniref:Carboxypeptidase-like regulatory domain-containing protein n=1 Tax=Pedobacter gandavensis TaxID=2679963 RepID=A0ABR6ERC9_9SPHI|nr:hypothetical protein [Pedobacter gandavensis]MBB2147818.1 hypothetical protein [Pedobacter gandavensis]